MPQVQLMERACPGQDIISELPDMIRLYILTLLPRKYAIRSGVLSSKWKDLWKQRFPHSSTLTFGRATDTEEDQRELANEIQEKMTQHGKKRIETFSLCFYPGKKHEQMTAEWVEQAVTNGVEEFHLDFAQGCVGNYPRKQLARRAKKFEMRESLFRCNNALTTLSLNYCRLQRYFKFRYFHCLETLCLRRVNINDFMLGKLVLNCPRLKSLELRQCLCLKHIKVPPTTLLSLEKLIIAYCTNTKEIKIAAPGLHTFYLFGNFPHSILMLNMPFLRDVILMAPSRHLWLSRIYHTLVFMRLDHAQVLTLCSSSLSVMFRFKDTPYSIIFEHLKELQLLTHMTMCSDLNNIYRLFTHCQHPLLERLSIELPTSLVDYGMNDDPQRLQDPPNIIFNHLKKIKMTNFKGFLNEMLLLDFLLQSAVNLEDVVLVLPREFYMGTTDINRLSRLFKDVMGKQRASTKVRIVMFYNYLDEYGFKHAHSNAILDFKNLQAEIFKNGV